MKRAVAAESPDAYVASLKGWQAVLVKALRAATLGAAELQEQIKWRHLVYFSGGPVLLIRAEEQRVLCGFWRGQRLRDLDERLKPGGKYEMATIILQKGDEVSVAQVRKLVRAAVVLNRVLGDPTDVAECCRH